MRAAFFDLDRALVRPEGWFKRSGVRRHARALIAAHHWRGHVVVFLSDGPAEWVEQMGRELQADGVLRRPAALQGPDTKRSERSATGAFEPVGIDGGGRGAAGALDWRSAAVRRFCVRYNFAPGASFGYGALRDDWLWLELLGHPAVAHPIGPLRRRARAARWPLFNLDGRGELSLPAALAFGSAPPCMTLT